MPFLRFIVNHTYVKNSEAKKGFWDGEYSHDKIGNKLALVHSEVTEVLEAIRKSKGSEQVVEEMADVIIRLLDVYAAMRNEEQILTVYTLCV